MSFKTIKSKGKDELRGKYFHYFFISLISAFLAFEMRINFSQYPNFINIVQISYLLLLIGLFVKPVYVTGAKSVYITGDFKNLKKYFVKEHYFKICLLFALRRIIIFIGFLFFIIPGIYLSLTFSFLPYVILENENMTISEILKKCIGLTRGKKLMILKFILSFAGYYLLGFVLGFVGIFFVNPYFEMSFKDLYTELTDNEIEK
jgi:uncharacterized membrane protein